MKITVEIPTALRRFTDGVQTLECNSETLPDLLGEIEGRFPAIANFQSEIDVFADFFLQDIGCFVGSPVVFDQCFTNFLGTGAHQFQLALQKKTEAIDRIDVEWIANRHHQAGLAESDRDDLENDVRLRPGFD